MRTRTALAFIAALLLALTGCSSGSDDKANAAPAGSSAAKKKTDADKATLEQAVRDYTAALFSGDASGYNLVSARCQKQMSAAAFTTLAKDAHQQYGSQKATGVHIDQIAGDLARVSYGAGNIPQFNRESQAWTREGGTWRWDACPSIG
ncbi:hypothetical protein ACGFS9_30025 [Streptomyces sp. NPDC048566]|uniref:hypothetical protein n=1 Tax=Streptomyces sp. NPDC048566 TaxID=3365569 RepID=UPI0037128DE0